VEACVFARMSIPGPIRGFLWPVGNLITMAALPSAPATGHGTDGKTPAATHFSGKPVADTVMDHVAVQLSTIPKLALAAFVWARLSGGASWQASALALDRDWVLSIFVRDMLMTWLIAGGWEFTLYSRYSPFSQRLRGHKLNPELPAPDSRRWPFTNPHMHDAFWSTVSTLIWSAMEVATAHAWAKGAVKLPAGGATPGDAWWLNSATLIWLATMPYWRLAHFYFLHRSMHKWFPGRAPGTGWCPDVGAVLYEWVHSLHHKSKNPTCWSGVSMHPVESSTYYTAMWVPIAVAAAAGLPGVHPIVMLYTKMDLHFAALIGHDGIGYPGNASQAHWLHHNNFDCNVSSVGDGRTGRRARKPTPHPPPPPPRARVRRPLHPQYGENYAPFDWLFGSWAKDEADFQKMKAGWDSTKLEEKRAM
jgi:sterol desaturase/sphingolipid hydroxylase (fatty acid hydroxylase superfamily)